VSKQIEWAGRVWMRSNGISNKALEEKINGKLPQSPRQCWIDSVNDDLDCKCTQGATKADSTDRVAG